MINKKGFTLILCAVFMFVSLLTAMPSHGKNILNRIEETGKVNMGFREGSVPFGFINKKGEWMGFDLDLGEEIVKALEQKYGKKIKLVKKPINPKTRIPLVVNGTVDIGIGSTTITLAREVADQDKVHLVMGGFHLLGDQIQLQKTIDYFQRNKVDCLYPMHCTDLKSLSKFHERFGIRKLCAGDTIEIKS